MKLSYCKLFLSVLALSLLLVANMGLIDDVAQKYTAQGFSRALISYGVARSLNGAISVAQGTEVAVEPAGVGLTFTPGEILDPVNDLIERFSWVVLASSTSLGIQRVLLEITSSIWFTLLVTVVVLLAIFLMWWHGPLPVWVKGTVYRCAAVLMILRFAIPGLAIVSEGVYSFFLEPRYTESRIQLQETAQTLGEINRDNQQSQPDGEDLSFLENARRAYQSVTSGLNVQARVDDYKKAAANVSEHAIDLIVVFVLQTILLPLLFLWLTIQVLKMVIRVPYG